MAEISPFRGARFNSAKAGDPSQLISPPYDIIDPVERYNLHARNPYNFVRLVLGEERADDTDAANRFTRAGEFLRQWLDEGVLTVEDKPALYRQKIKYNVLGRLKTLYGLTAIIKLHPYEDQVILPHEKTLRGPKEGLTRLMDTTGANLDSVWLMYEDNFGGVREALDNLQWRSAVKEATDTNGVTYGLDLCDDTAAIDMVVNAMSGETLTIADGHHRYETALEYARARRAAEPARAESPYDWMMATLAWTDDPGLTVLPTHRVLKGLLPQTVASIPEVLRANYEVSHASGGRLAQALAAAGESAFAVWDGKDGWVAAQREPVDRLGAELSQEAVLAGILHFDTANLKTDPRISYVEDFDEALQMVANEGYQSAILLNPIAVRTITRYAREGRAMPQKSTYFYPKLASGLVLRLIQGAPVVC